MSDVKFKNLSTLIGSNTDLVQGAGGNTSIKNDKGMLIKASGTWLSNANKENIFVTVNEEIIKKNIFDGKKNPIEGSIIDQTSLRPSIETTLHALMPHKIVLHTHPTKLISHLIAKNGKEYFNSILSNENWSWIPYARPGIDLSKKIIESIGDNNPNILLLANHGLVVGGNNCDEAENLMNRILDKCRYRKREFLQPTIDSTNILAKKLKMRLPQYKDIHALAMDEITFNRSITNNGILYPDQAVFLGYKMPCYFKLEEFLKEKEVLRNYPKHNFLILKNEGVFINEDMGNDIDEMLLAHSRILQGVSEEVKINYLSKNDVNELLNWEPEKYRIQMKKDSNSYRY